GRASASWSISTSGPSSASTATPATRSCPTARTAGRGAPSTSRRTGTSACGSSCGGRAAAVGGAQGDVPTAGAAEARPVPLRDHPPDQGGRRQAGAGAGRPGGHAPGAAPRRGAGRGGRLPPGGGHGRRGPTRRLGLRSGPGRRADAPPDVRPADRARRVWRPGKTRRRRDRRAHRSDKAKVALAVVEAHFKLIEPPGRVAWTSRPFEATALVGPLRD